MKQVQLQFLFLSLIYILSSVECRKYQIDVKNQEELDIQLRKVLMYKNSNSITELEINHQLTELYILNLNGLRYIKDIQSITSLRISISYLQSIKGLSFVWQLTNLQYLYIDFRNGNLKQQEVAEEFANLQKLTNLQGISLIFANAIYNEIEEFMSYEFCNQVTFLPGLKYLHLNLSQAWKKPDNKFMDFINNIMSSPQILNIDLILNQMGWYEEQSITIKINNPNLQQLKIELQNNFIGEVLIQVIESDQLNELELQLQQNKLKNTDYLNSLLSQNVPLLQFFTLNISQNNIENTNGLAQMTLQHELLSLNIIIDYQFDINGATVQVPKDQLEGFTKSLVNIESLQFLEIQLRYINYQLQINLENCNDLQYFALTNNHATYNDEIQLNSITSVSFSDNLNNLDMLYINQSHSYIDTINSIENILIKSINLRILELDLSYNSINYDKNLNEVSNTAFFGSNNFLFIDSIEWLIINLMGNYLSQKDIESMESFVSKIQQNEGDFIFSDLQLSEQYAKPTDEGINSSGNGAATVDINNIQFKFFMLFLLMIITI